MKRNNMNIELSKDLHEQWNILPDKSEQNLIDLLIASGANPEKHKTEILDFIDNSGIPIDIGKDTVTFYYEYAMEHQKRLKQQKEQQQRRAIDNRIQALAKFVDDYNNNKDAITPDGIKDVIKDVVKITDDIETIVKPPKVDYTELLKPTSKESFKERIKNRPKAIKTSYKINESHLRFATGALSIIAGATGHGKTTFLINILLDVARLDPKKRHWLFSYEEDETAILLKALNSFCDYDYGSNNKRVISGIYRGYGTFANNKDQEHFKDKEQEFWNLVEKGTINIIHADYSAEELIKAIRTVSGDDAGFIGIDYIQLLYPDERSSTRQEELKRICLGLKDLAIETKKAIVATGQFTREVSTPELMAPQKLADASDIEKASNKILGIWNGDNKTESTLAKSGEMYLKVLKARDERNNIYTNLPWNGNKGVIGFEKVLMTQEEAKRINGKYAPESTDNSTLTKGDIL